MRLYGMNEGLLRQLGSSAVIASYDMVIVVLVR